MSLDGEDRCWRQIHPSWLTDDFFILEAFIPATKDNRQLSVGHSSKISAEDCFADYTQTLHSAGVAQFMVHAIAEASKLVAVSVALLDDSMLPGRPAWHCYVNFGQINERLKRKQVAQRLWLAAKSAGWAYQLSA
jgi:hypothetical protein